MASPFNIPASFWPSVRDLSGRSTYRSRGPMANVNGIIFHHSGGRGDAAGVIDTLNKRGYGAQFIIDRQGNVYRGLPAGYRGAQIKNSATGLNNSNTIGIEVVANDNGDVTPAQIKAGEALAAALMQQYNVPPQMIWGHGEVNPGHKMADEGLAIVSAIRNAYGIPAGGVTPTNAVAGARALNDIVASYAPMQTTTPAEKAVNTMATAMPPPMVPKLPTPATPLMPTLPEIPFQTAPSPGDAYGLFGAARSQSPSIFAASPPSFPTIPMPSAVLPAQAGGSSALPPSRSTRPSQVQSLLALATQAAKQGIPFLPTGQPGAQGGGIVSGESGTFLVDPSKQFYTSLTNGKRFSLNPGLPR